MANIFIFHGVGGHPLENWFPWLKKELEKLGHSVFIPQFPTPEGQTLDNWLNVLARYTDKISNNTILVGHSLGVAFTLSVIEKYPVHAAFLIAGFTGKTGSQYDKGMKTFAKKSFNWTRIRRNCRRFFVFHSDNDPYVPLKKGNELARNLGTGVILVKNGGHINETAGYGSFELLLNEIKKII